MSRAVLVYWKPEAAAPLLDKLRAAGWEADLGPVHPPELFRQLKSKPPDAVVIDLSRMPSHGKALGIYLRQTKWSRMVPLVFVGGEAEKVEEVRVFLPDATFAEWRTIRSALKRCMKLPANLVVPGVSIASPDTPLHKRMGIKPKARVLLIDAPNHFEELLAPLPEGVKIERDGKGPADVVILFIDSRDSLVLGLEGASRAMAGRSALWLAYPKQTSGKVTGLTQAFLREYALTQGLVDYKVCSIDQTWTGLCFAYRKT